MGFLKRLFGRSKTAKDAAQRALGGAVDAR